MRTARTPNPNPKRKALSATVLLLPEDEVALQAAVLSACPGVRIIDAHGEWRGQTTSKPPVRDSVLDVSQRALLWDPVIHPRLPSLRFSGLAARSPLAGKVVQWRLYPPSQDKARGAVL